MAESTKNSLLCSVCLETFKEPKVLPCCHTFCKECLTKLPVIKKSQSRTISEEKVDHAQSYDSVETRPPRCRTVNLESASASAMLPQDFSITLPLELAEIPKVSIADLFGGDEIVCGAPEAEIPKVSITDLFGGDEIVCGEAVRKTEDPFNGPDTIEIDEPLVYGNLRTQSALISTTTCTPAYEVPPVVIEKDSLGVESFAKQDVEKSENSELKDASMYGTVGYIACPQCRSEHKLSGQNGVDRFLTDYVIEAQIREQNISSNKTTCDECESTERVVSFCNDCTEYLCNFCTKAHERQKRFVGHNVTSIVLNVGVKRGTPIRKRTVLVCPQHHGEIIQLFCQQCETVVCNKCIVSVHSAHKLSEIDSKTRQRIDEQLTSLSTRMDKELTLQAENLKYVNKVEKMSNDMVTDLQQKINKRFDAYSAAVERRRKELLSNCESKSTAKMKMLWSQRDSLETVIADMTATQNFTKRVRKCEDNGEFLLLTSQVLPRLKKLESWKWNDEVVENLELYSVDFQESSVDVSLISRAGTIKEKQLPRYTIDFQGFIENATLGKTHRFTIHVYRGKGCRSLTGIETPSVSLRHIRSQTCDVATVRIMRAERKSSKRDSLSLNTYDWTVTYTPYCGGQHKLTIQFDNTTTEREIIVLGIPEIGSRVMRGPDGHGPVDGTVIRQRYSTLDTNKVKVQLNHYYGNYRVQEVPIAKYFSWGAGGGYEVQLFH